MCGIFVCVHGNDQSRIEPDRHGRKILEARGPDDGNVFPGKGDQQLTGCTIEFRRLSIVDESAPCPPWVHVSGDGGRTVALVCNGEIYNHTDLRDAYEGESDYLMTSECDTEALLAVYLAQGPGAMFEEANGAFAIVVVEWEEGHLSRVVAGRDPFGIKPLFFAHYGETAGRTDLSPWEPGALPSAGFSLVSSLAIVGDAYNGGAELPPGTWIDIDVSQASMATHTHYTCPPLSASVPQNGLGEVGAFMDVLSEAVEDRLMGDGNVAVLLSGGVDSAVVAALAARALEKRGEGKLHTFTVVCTDTGGSDSPDAIYARAVAGHIGADHTEIPFTVEDGLDAMPAVIAAIGTMEAKTVPAAVVGWLAARHICENTEYKVVLVGEGADEVFAGYSLFSGATANDVADFASEVNRRLERVGDAELLRVDRSTMAWGLEARVPFLDRNVVAAARQCWQAEALLSHPVTGRLEKGAFRAAVREWDPSLLPSAVLERRKAEFATGVGGEWSTAAAKAMAALDRSLLTPAQTDAVEWRSRARRRGRVTLPSPPDIRPAADDATGVGGATCTDPLLRDLVSEQEALDFLTTVLALDVPNDGNGLPEPSLDWLNAIVGACLAVVPFHNLTVITASRRPPTPAEIKADMMAGLGGTCVVINAFLAAVLHRLGFAVGITPCDIDGRQDCHLGLIVAHGGRLHFVDCANGKPYLVAAPLLPSPASTYTHAGFNWSLSWNPTDERWSLLHGDSEALSFDPRRLVHLSYFHPMVTRSRTVPGMENRFLTAIRLARIDRGETLVGVRDRAIIHGSKPHRLHCNDDDLCAFVQQCFPSVPLGLFERALQLLRACSDGGAFGTPIPPSPSSSGLVAIIGDASLRSSDNPDAPSVALLAYEVGRELALAGYGIVTGGGSDGVPGAAARGHSEGCNQRDGNRAALPRIAISPLTCESEAKDQPWNATSPHATEVIYTGLGEHRNAVVGHAGSSAVVAIGGGAGTLTELTAAYTAGRRCVVLTGVAGETAKFANLPVGARGRRQGRVVAGAASAVEVVALVSQALVVTGAAGFIGSHMVEEALRRWPNRRIVAIDSVPEQHCYDRQTRLGRWRRLQALADTHQGRLELQSADVGDADAMGAILARHRPSTVIHLAGIPGVRYCQDQADLCQASNVGATQVLVAAMDEACPGSHLVFASSSSVYGNGGAETGSTEDDPLAPASLYARSKVEAEAVVATLQQCSATIARFFTVYGPRGRPDMLVGKFLTAMADGTTFTLYGDGSQQRDFTFVGDTVEGVCRMVEQRRQATRPIGEPVRVFNLGGGTPVTVRRILEALGGQTLEDLVADGVVEYGAERAEDVQVTRADSSRARRLLGWTPKVQVEVGLGRTVSSYSGPRVGVVIATIPSRRGLLLSRSLPSACRQTHPPEVVVVVVDGAVDDASFPAQREAILATGRSVLGATGAAGASTVLLVIPNQRTPRRASGAWNTGIMALTGVWDTLGGAEQRTDFVAVLDDDDEWLPDHLETCVGAANDEGVAMVVPRFARVPDGGSRGQVWDPLRGGSESSMVVAADLSVQTFLAGNPGIQGSNLFVRLRTLHEAGLFDEGAESGTDRDLMARFIGVTASVEDWIVAVRKVTVVHYADSDRSRLSLGPVKQRGLDRFWLRWAPVMTSATSCRHLQRAKDYFSWIPPMESADDTGATDDANPSDSKETDEQAGNGDRLAFEPYNLLIAGIVSSDGTRLQPLLDDIGHFLARSPHIAGRVKVVVVENGTPDGMEADSVVAAVESAQERFPEVDFVHVAEAVWRGYAAADPSRFGINISAGPGQAPIAETRTVLQTLVAEAWEEEGGDDAHTNEHGARVVAWILDDDKRLVSADQSVGEALAARATLEKNAEASGAPLVGAVLGVDVDAPPLPAAFVLRTGMVDLNHRIDCEASDHPYAATGDLGDACAATCRDYYHDLSEEHYSHLETPFLAAGHSVEEMATAVACGRSVARPLGWRGGKGRPEPTDSYLRGGSTFVFHRRLLLIPNDAPEVPPAGGGAPVRSRRSDMLWAMAVQASGWRSVLCHTAVVRHDRRAETAERWITPGTAQQAAVADILGSSVVRAVARGGLVGADGRVPPGAFADAVQRHASRRVLALHSSLVRAEALAAAIVIRRPALADRMDAVTAVASEVRKGLAGSQLGSLTLPQRKALDDWYAAYLGRRDAGYLG